MDNFRQPHRASARYTIDGFAQSSGGSRPVVRPRIAVAQKPVVHPRPSRRIDDFRPPLALKTMGSNQLSAPQPSAPSVSRSLPKIDLALDDMPAPAHKKLDRGRTFRRWTIRTVVTVLVLAIGIGGFLGAQGYMKVHKVFKGNATTAAALKANVNPTLLKGEGDGRVNILLLGIGGGNHDGPDLTDTMIIASIDPVNKKATLLSVPRDLWVKMPNNFMGNYQKINAAYEAGKYEYLGKEDGSSANTKAVEAGFQSADQVVSQVLGIPIHYNLLVDFQAFQQAIDTVGGVTVNVPSQLYDPTMAWENNWNPVLAQPGVQNFNGKQALLYVRSRETSSDFARCQRQRSVILALKDKVLTLGTLSNPLKISQLMGAFGDNVVTDISLSDAVRMYDLTKGIGNSDIQSLDLVTAPNSYITTGNMNGISVDEPKAGLYDYSAIQKYVRSSLVDGYIAKENAKITVLNGTSIPGLATDKADELKSYGYNVATVDNAPTQGYMKTQIIDLTNGADKYTKHYLENRFGVTATTQLPPNGSIQPGDANFIIVLGSDETISSQN